MIFKNAFKHSKFFFTLLLQSNRLIMDGHTDVNFPTTYFLMWIFLSPAKLHMLKIINHQLFVILSSLLITFSWKKNNICLSPIYFTQAHLFLVSFFFYKSLFLVSNLSFHCKIIFIVFIYSILNFFFMILVD